MFKCGLYPIQSFITGVLDEAKHAENMGITFGAPNIDLKKLEGYKNKVVKQLTGGLAMLAKQRKVTVIQGVANFIDEHNLTVAKADGKSETVNFKNVIACGSSPIKFLLCLKMIVL